MKAVVVYESHWGNTAAIARAIAEGIGDARALTTDEAVGRELAGADLVVAGAPVMAFGLPREAMRDKVAESDGAAAPPDVSHPVLRTWLDGLPRASHVRAAAFDTRMRWTPRGAYGTIESKLRHAGYDIAAKGRGFVVQGTYGPLRDGELDRARAWGRELAELADTSLVGG